MTRLIFIKLGGSLITNKQVANTYHEAAVAGIGAVLKMVLDEQPDMSLLVGHGSGSFGHFAAQRYGTMDGVRTREDWIGFAHVAATAAELSGLVTKTLREQGLPVWRLQPSASAVCRNGELRTLALTPIREAIDRRLIPLVHGDVALDEVRGGTIISTESVFFYLARQLPVQEILLLGDRDGVLDIDGNIIPEISPINASEFASALGKSAGVDVTGGMADKVRQMLQLAESMPGLSIRIMTGDPSALTEVLSGQATHGTLIHAVS